jgi:protein subunit release factor A
VSLFRVPLSLSHIFSVSVSFGRYLEDIGRLKEEMEERYTALLQDRTKELKNQNLSLQNSLKKRESELSEQMNSYALELRNKFKEVCLTLLAPLTILTPPQDKEIIKREVCSATGGNEATESPGDPHIGRAHKI